MAKKKSARKIFALDTSVILFDAKSVESFDEHDVVFPITVLEELDNFKKGNETRNYEARQFIRFMDNLTVNEDIRDWIPLPGDHKGRIKVILDINGKEPEATKIYGNTNDNKILDACLLLQEKEADAQVTLVTKDINLRLKAKALGVNAEDYETVKVKNIDNLYEGITNYENFDQTIIDALYSSHHIPFEDLEGKMNLIANGYYILQGEKSSALAYYNPFDKQLERVNKQTCYGIKPKNAEQAFALHAILNENVKLVAIHGVAGTGKTLLALAGALEQRKNYKQIYLARPIVPLSNRDIGYLPGDIKSKIDPYMQPLWDNLKFIQNQYNESDKEYQNISKMIEQEKLLISPLAYIRGRSLSDIIFIVDEAQNLTPHEIKTIITRAGENAKFIFTGDIKQIDTPYLDDMSNGLSYIVDRLHGRDLFSTVKLVKGERSALANLANELL